MAQAHGSRSGRVIVLCEVDVSTPVNWRTTLATVYSCGVWGSGYRWGEGGWGGRRIVFCYVVNGQTYSGECIGSTAERGSTFEIRYDPDNPKQNDKSMGPKLRMTIDIVKCIGVTLLLGLLIWLREMQRHYGWRH
jgi:hypothetical protein